MLVTFTGVTNDAAVGAESPTQPGEIKATVVKWSNPNKGVTYSKHAPIRKSGLWALRGFSNSELTSVGSVSYSCSYLFFLLTNRPSEAFLI